MALYRPIKINFWTDADVLEFTPEEKYFYLYLLTNPNTSACGIYELPKRKVQYETGYNEDTVNKLLRKFADYGKIRYDERTKEVYILNWHKHNAISNVNLKKCVLGELKKIKSEEFKQDLLSVYNDKGIEFTDLAQYYRSPL